MQQGFRALGADVALGKRCVMRHGHRKPQAYNRQEKVYESKVRQAGKKEIRKALKSEG